MPKLSRTIVSCHTPSVPLSHLPFDRPLQINTLRIWNGSSFKDGVASWPQFDLSHTGQPSMVLAVAGCRPRRSGRES